MTYKVYKKSLEFDCVNHIEMPQYAQILRFDMQHGHPKIWYRFHSKFEIGGDYAAEILRFKIFGTGQDIPDEFNIFHGTCFNGPFLVWHLFEHPPFRH